VLDDREEAWMMRRMYSVMTRTIMNEMRMTLLAMMRKMKMTHYRWLPSL